MKRIIIDTDSDLFQANNKGDRKGLEADMREEQTGKPPIARYSGCGRVPWEECEFSKLLLDTARSLIIILDREARILAFNRACEEVTGYTAGEVIGRQIFDFLIPEEQREGVRRVFQALSMGMFPNRYQNDWIRKDGQRCWIEWSNTAIPDETGLVAYIIGTGVDVTDRLVAEAQAQANMESLRTSEQRLRVIFEEAPVGLAMADRTGAWISANDRFRRMLGLPLDALPPGGGIWDLVPGLAGSGESSLLAAPLTEPIALDREWKTDGGDRWFSVHVAPVLRENRLDEAYAPPAEGYIAVVEDITDKINAVRQKQAMERRIRHSMKFESLGVLAGGIAHEFNNILMTVLGNADLILQELENTTAVRSYAEQIQLSVRRAAELARQLLVYAGKERMIREPVSLSVIIEQMIPLYQATLPKSVVVRYIPRKGVPPITGDASQLRQCLTNLVLNAMEALPDKQGTITLTVGTQHCDAAYLADTVGSMDLREGLYAWLEVLDTGSGMDREIIPRIFDPFFTTRFPGRGLGLAAVRGVVAAHGGAIKVYSEPGRGTSVKLLFPVDEANQGDQGKPVNGTIPAMPPGRRPRVLLADDEQAVRNVACRMLERLGFEPTGVINGREVLDTLGRDPAAFDLVVVDMTMPELDGVALFDEIRKLRADIPVFVCSGFTEDEMADKFAGRDVAGFIAKPFSLRSLSAALDAYLPSGEDTST